MMVLSHLFKCGVVREEGKMRDRKESRGRKDWRRRGRET
jgi:hypothetical protein